MTDKTVDEQAQALYDWDHNGFDMTSARALIRRLPEVLEKLAEMGVVESFEVGGRPLAYRPLPRPKPHEHAWRWNVSGTSKKLKLRWWCDAATCDETATIPLEPPS